MRRRPRRSPLFPYPALSRSLRGKRKPAYTPHVDVGDFVVVVNAEKIAVTGAKLREKMYYRHSGYPGGLDRKSTRLNSSHANISYAVFCLKKNSHSTSVLTLP